MSRRNWSSIFKNWKLLLASFTLLVSFGYVIPHGSRIAEPTRTEWVQRQEAKAQIKSNVYPVEHLPTLTHKFPLCAIHSHVQLALKGRPNKEKPIFQRKTTTSTSSEEDDLSPIAFRLNHGFTRS